MKKKSKLLIIVLSFSMLLFVPTFPASALEMTESEVTAMEVEPCELAGVNDSLLRNDNIKFNTLSLNWINGKAKCTATITGYAFVSNVSISMTLYKQNGSNWDYVGRWSDSTEGTYLHLTDDSVTPSSGYYRLIGTFVADGEVITKEVYNTY